MITTSINCICGNLRCVGLLGNSQACLATFSAVLGILCNVLGMLATFSTSSACIFARSLKFHIEENSPTCCLISCEVKGIVYHQTSIYETRWYATPLTSQLIRQQVEEFFFDMGLLGPYKNACQGRRGRCKHAQDVAKHAEDGRERCQACLRVAKQAYTSQVPTLFIYQVFFFFF